jgi:hypothetical protein
MDVDKPEHQAADMTPEDVARRLNEEKWRGREDWQAGNSGYVTGKPGYHDNWIPPVDARVIVVMIDAQRELARVQAENIWLHQHNEARKLLARIEKEAAQ